MCIHSSASNLASAPLCFRLTPSQSVVFCVCVSCLRAAGWCTAVPSEGALCLACMLSYLCIESMILVAHVSIDKIGPHPPPCVTHGCSSLGTLFPKQVESLGEKGCVCVCVCVCMGLQEYSKPRSLALARRHLDRRRLIEAYRCFYDTRSALAIALSNQWGCSSKRTHTWADVSQRKNRKLNASSCVCDDAFTVCVCVSVCVSLIIYTQEENQALAWLDIINKEEK
jgi:hypothetical protein